VSFDVSEVFDRGGRELIDLLEYCVLSMKFDVLFVFAAREYRMGPSVPAALALYDVFCAPAAPAPLTVRSLLPPRDLRLPHLVEPLRRLLERAQLHAADSEGPLPVLPAPASHLFDHLASRLATDPEGAMARLGGEYDPRLEPVENLPGGRMTAGQRAFVENVWRLSVRPWLVASGFRRMANVA
jgi:hypothetical protein